MCMGAPSAPAFQPPPPPPPAPEKPMPSATAETVKQSGPASPFAVKPRSRRNPFRVGGPQYDSGAPDSVATGLNIPV